MYNLLTIFLTTSMDFDDLNIQVLKELRACDKFNGQLDMLWDDLVHAKVRCFTLPKRFEGKRNEILRAGHSAYG
mgnify:CR=1 FL=1